MKDSNEFLSDEYKPFNDFREFEEDDMPQNSDIVFILSQYLQCYEKLRSDNVQFRHSSWFWAIPGEKGDKADDNGLIYIRTIKPKKLKE